MGTANKNIYRSTSFPKEDMRLKIRSVQKPLARRLPKLKRAVINK